MSNRREKYRLGVRLLWDIFPKSYVEGFFLEWTPVIHGESKQLSDFKNAYKEYIDKKTGEKSIILYDSDTIVGRDCIAVDIFELYFAWLSIMVFEWLEENDIRYYYINIEGGDSPEHMRGDAHDFYMYERGRNPVIMQNGIPGWYLSDRDIDGYHVVGGIRRTCNVPQKFINTCYMLGACITLGSYTRDEDTIESIMQAKLNEQGKRIRFLNYSCGSNSDVIVSAINTFHRVLNIKPLAGDILVFFDKDSTLARSLPYLKDRNRRFDIKDAFAEYENVKCFKDNEWYHINKDGNRMVAKFLLDIIDFDERENAEDMIPPVCNKVIDSKENFIAKSLQSYIERVAKERMPFQNTGAIVMNCNPFTKGHLYLVEQARKQVEFLYVFVVEEDKSFFSFKDRVAIAIENCKKFNNVKVLPSGMLMISSYTFAEYFNKDDIQDEKISPISDVNIFGAYIAPFFRIKKRFVGTEPLDNVTRQYNETMKMHLADFGIELIEIDRLQNENNPISATTVRSAIKNGDIVTLKELLPDASYEYLKKHRLLRD
ncbi:[citrate (pro-3S)-lyase] ligase [Selenomonas ruminantium]|uniref:[citrate (Pro-3S)-lyase] ligase n=1 Tax=Selenomonas ruminantium TaxID=971 RepID=A0A1I3CPZ0_SELRU|nr:adenylyltransferase/cytidyltransferase family protein [Selenomonas ruminantium]SFH76574.1 [citrate (pro-3S)-lyase] ligase [Selenomonas ruminantium]